MTGIQKEYAQTGFFHSEFAESFYSNIMFQKINDLEQQLSSIENELNAKKQNVVFYRAPAADQSLLTEGKTSIQTKDCWQYIRKIAERALEILSEWEDVDDIKIQIQYAAIIVGKIDKIKKNDLIRTDDTRNKICTLLRNVIRLNASAELFSKEQISVLKEGFSFITSDNLQKENLFQMNRTLRKKGLATMPAWE